METHRGWLVPSIMGLSALACSVVDDDEPPTSDTAGTDGDADDHQTCENGVQVIAELDCPSGYTPQMHYDGGSSRIINVDDPALAADLAVGLLVGFGVGADADWVGYGVTQNSKCTFGCFIGCQPGQMGCVGDPLSEGGCLLCGNDIVASECTEFVAACMPGDPEDDGGLDETGSGETTGRALEDAPFDCSQWHPEGIRQLVPGGTFPVPQAIVDQLVLGSADPLAECDGLRLRSTSDGYWVISQMRTGGLLGALGLRVGDELRALDDVELDSLDALASVLGRFVDEDGTPRRFVPTHPGFSLRVRRGERDFVRRLRVVPSTTGGERDAR